MTTTVQDPRLQTSDPDDTVQRVLVVDDEPSICALLTLALSYEGWDVRTANSGAEAVEAARTFRPDAVLLDLMLPDMNGLEVLRHLREEAPGLPVVFVSARDGADDRVAGLTAGGDDYITKPFRLEDVSTRLCHLLRQSAGTVARAGALVVGDLVLDDERREVARAGEVI